TPRAQDPAMSLMARVPAAAGLGGLAGPDTQRIHAVLTSDSVTDAVIEKFGLMERYDKRHLVHARKAVLEHCSADVDRKSGVVSLACEDQDPRRAMEMVAFFGEIGNRVFGRISATSAREERAFLELQVAKAREDVDIASRALRAFQEQHK